MRARVVAPLVAAILGIGGGVATALVVPEDDSTTNTSTFNDPLHLGIPLVDQDCTGESLLVVGYGDNVAPLGTAVADNSSGKPRYLRTDESCATILGPEGASAPTYAVYLGPYQNLQEPCEKRLTPDHRADFVTVLRSGNQTLVKCPCALPASAGPPLLHGRTEFAAEETVWIRALQSMLNDYDAKKFPRTAITGRYDDATVARVTEIQHEQSGIPVIDGEIDSATWGILTDRICRIYNY
jgi:hypothetical protein